MEETTTPDSFALQIDNGNISYLSEAAKWAKFLAIVGFIFCALFVILGVFAGTFFASSVKDFDSDLQGMSSIGTGIFTVWFVIIALLSFIPTLYLFNFASKMQVALRTNDQISLNNSFKNLKSCLKFMGLLLIIILCIDAIGFIFSLIAGIGLSR